MPKKIVNVKGYKRYVKGKVVNVKPHKRKIDGRQVILKDSSSDEFLNANIKDEREAIEIYMKESDRTDDGILKEFYHALAIDEMRHLLALESLRDNTKKVPDGIDKLDAVVSTIMTPYLFEVPKEIDRKYHEIDRRFLLTSPTTGISLTDVQKQAEGLDPELYVLIRKFDDKYYLYTENRPMRKRNR